MIEHFKYGDIQVDITLPTRVNVVSGDSGTGKTFLVKVLAKLSLKGYDVITIKHDNYKGFSPEAVKKVSSNTLLLLDNADLYMSDKFKDAILQSNAICIIFTRSTVYFNGLNAGRCTVEYDNKRLCIREFVYEDNFRRP